MKKYALIVAALFGTSVAMAQDEAMTNKNGMTILPEAGDYAIQMDAVPLLNFGLNAVNIGADNGNYAQHPGYVSGFNQVLVGKYFASESVAYRGRLAINSASSTTTTYTPDDVNGWDDPSTVEDEREEYADKSQMGYWNVTLGGGMEWRRGHGRLQGFYGGEVFIGLGKGDAGNMNVSNEYGIEYSATAEDSGFVAPGPGSGRVLSTKQGMMFMIGARGFAGVEYFVAPKIAIGAEFGWGLAYQRTGRSTTNTEYWVDTNTDGTGDEAQTIETQGATQMGQSGFRVDNGWNNGSFLNGSGSLTVTFHF